MGSEQRPKGIGRFPANVYSNTIKVFSGRGGGGCDAAMRRCVICTRIYFFALRIQRRAAQTTQRDAAQRVGAFPAQRS